MQQYKVLLIANNLKNRDIIGEANSQLYIEDSDHFKLDDNERRKKDFSTDSFLAKGIKKELTGKQYNLIVIEYSLDASVYLSYLGIRLGIHIRLTPELKHQNCPILFIGPDKLSEIIRFSDYTSFIGSKGVYHSEQRNIKSLYEQIQQILEQKIDISNDYFDIISKIHLTPSSFLDSSHSIANEFGIMYLDKLSGHNVLGQNHKELEIQSDLFSKLQLVLSKSSFLEKNSKEKFTIDANGKKILLIEDEWQKGWLNLYKAILKDAEIEHLELDKASKRSDVLELLDKKLDESNDWDLFIVDIRLTDDDHNTKDYKTLTGFSVIEKIKSKNSGYQVIVTSASNKHWIYDYGKNINGNDVGADEIWIKPGLINQLNENSIFDNLEAYISRCFERYYLRMLISETTIFKKNVLGKSEFIKSECDSLLFYINLFESELKKELCWGKKNFNIACFFLYTVIEYMAGKLIDNTPYSLENNTRKYTFYWRGTKKPIFRFKHNIRKGDFAEYYEGNGNAKRLDHTTKLLNLLTFDNDSVKGINLKIIIDNRNLFIHPSPDHSVTTTVENAIDLLKICNQLVKGV